MFIGQDVHLLYHGDWWIQLAFLILVLLFTSAIFAAYFAVNRGQPAGWWFLKGFFIPVLGPLMIAKMPAVDRQARRARGLTKLPRTVEAMPCEICGHLNHPAAERCAKCHAPLIPEYETEIQQVKKDKTPENIS